VGFRWPLLGVATRGMAYYGSSPASNRTSDAAWYKTAVDRSSQAGSAAHLGGGGGGSINFASNHDDPEYTHHGAHQSPYGGFQPEGSFQMDKVPDGAEYSRKQDFTARSNLSQENAGSDDDDYLRPVHISAAQFHQLAQQTQHLERRYDHLVARNKMMGDRVMRMRNNFKNPMQFSKEDKEIKQRAWSSWVTLVKDFRLENNIEKQTVAIDECHQVAQELKDALAHEKQLKKDIEEAGFAAQDEAQKVWAVCEQAQKSIEQQQAKMQQLSQRLRVAEELIGVSKQEANKTSETLAAYDTRRKDAERRITDGREDRGARDRSHDDLGDRVEYSNQVRQLAQGVTSEARALLPHLQGRPSRQRSPMPQQQPQQQAPYGTSSPSRPLQHSRPAPLDRFGTTASESPSPLSGARGQESFVAQPGMWVQSPMAQVRHPSPMHMGSPVMWMPPQQAASQPPSPMAGAGGSPSKSFNAYVQYERPAPKVQWIPNGPAGGLAGVPLQAAGNAETSAPSFEFRSTRMADFDRNSAMPAPAPSMAAQRFTAGSTANLQGPASPTYRGTNSPIYGGAMSYGPYMTAPGNYSPMYGGGAVSATFGGPVASGSYVSGTGRLAPQSVQSMASSIQAPSVQAPGRPAQRSTLSGSPSARALGGAVGAPSDGEVVEQWMCVRRPGANGQTTVTPTAISSGGGKVAASL